MSRRGSNAHAEQETSVREETQKAGKVDHVFEVTY